MALAVTDIVFIDHGSLVGIQSATEEGMSWVEDLEAEDWQWLGPVLWCDHRMAQGLITKAQEDGLNVEIA